MIPTRFIPVVLAALQLAHAVPNWESLAGDGLVRYTQAEAGEECGFVGNNFGVCRLGLCCSSEDHICRNSSRPCDQERCVPHLSSAFTCPVKPSDGNPPDGDHNDSDKDKDGKHGLVSIPIETVEELPRPHFGSVPYGQVINSCTAPGTIALTFDDGPWTYTSELLDLLDDEGVSATFFVNGSNMDWDQIVRHGNPNVLRRMRATGHQIGSHTWGHPDLATMGEDQAQDQLLKNEHALASVLGVIPTYLRPPYLSTAADTLNLADKLGYHVIGLDLDTQDWEHDYNVAEQNYLSKIRSSDPRSSSHLVLAHDIHKETVREFAQFMIDEGRAAGYRFVTVGECLGDPEHHWYRNTVNGGPVALKLRPPRDVSEEPAKDSTTRPFGFETYPTPVIRPSGFETFPRPALRDSIPLPTQTFVIETINLPLEIGALPYPGEPAPIKPDKKTTKKPRPRPTPTTTIDIPFPFSGGQLPPPGFHMKPELIESHEEEHDDEQEGESDDLSPPPHTKVVLRSVPPTHRPTPTTTIDVDFDFTFPFLSDNRVPIPGVHMKPEMIEKAKRRVEEDHDGQEEQEKEEEEEEAIDNVFFIIRDVLTDGNSATGVETQTTTRSSSSGFVSKETPTTTTPTPTPSPMLNYYSGGPVSKASSTMALVIGIAVMVVYHV